MKERQFEKEIAKIQKLLDMNDWEFSYILKDSPWFLWEVTQIDYKRFQAAFTFDSRLLTETDEYIRKVILHEVCHIFTIMNLRQFLEDDYLKNQIGWNTHAEIVTRMDILNEQMTVRLERVISKLISKTNSQLEYKQ